MEIKKLEINAFLSIPDLKMFSSPIPIPKISPILYFNLRGIKYEFLYKKKFPKIITTIKGSEKIEKLIGWNVFYEFYRSDADLHFSDTGPHKKKLNARPFS